MTTQAFPYREIAHHQPHPRILFPSRIFAPPGRGNASFEPVRPFGWGRTRFPWIFHGCRLCYANAQVLPGSRLRKPHTHSGSQLVSGNLLALREIYYRASGDKVFVWNTAGEFWFALKLFENTLKSLEYSWAKSIAWTFWFNLSFFESRELFLKRKSLSWMKKFILIKIF